MRSIHLALTLSRHLISERRISPIALHRLINTPLSLIVRHTASSIMPNNLTLVPMSLHSFCESALELFRKDHGAFVHFVLSGRQKEEQVNIDPILNAVTRHEGLSLLRDYDSLLGIDDHIQVQAPLTVYPVARRQDTLVSDVHLKYEFTTSRVCVNIF